VKHAAIVKKVGEEAARRCRLISHDHRGNVVNVGRTTLGTPIDVNPELLRSDCIIGVGGVYPQGTAWLGGGSKLALGVLGGRSIFALHYEHSVEGLYSTDNRFRRDLDEIARIIRLDTVVTVHINARREVIRLSAGDPVAIYPEAAAYSRQTFSAPPPYDADVVVSNAYPMDVSATFALAKGMTPLAAASPHASRVLVAACSEGAGLHPFFPLKGTSVWERRVALARHLARTRPHRLGGLVAATPWRVIQRLMTSRVRPQSGRGQGTPPSTARPVLMHIPTESSSSVAGILGQTTVIDSWPRVVSRVRNEQGSTRPCKVQVYPCAPLQLIDRSDS
jgi:nickel-dependent lactate racemase